MAPRLNSIQITTKRSTQKMKLPSDFTPGPYSVICGRGKTCTSSPGNKYLRSLVKSYLAPYSMAKNKAEKTTIVSAIVDRVRELSPEGSFVKQEGQKEEDGGEWWEVDDSFAREKIGCIFRDILHTQYRSSTKAKQARKKALEGAASWNQHQHHDHQRNNYLVDTSSTGGGVSGRHYYYTGAHGSRDQHWSTPTSSWETTRSKGDSCSSSSSPGEGRPISDGFSLYGPETETSRFSPRSRHDPEAEQPSQPLLNESSSQVTCLPSNMTISNLVDQERTLFGGGGDSSYASSSEEFLQGSPHQEPHTILSSGGVHKVSSPGYCSTTSSNSGRRRHSMTSNTMMKMYQSPNWRYDVQKRSEREYLQFAGMLPQSLDGPHPCSMLDSSLSLLEDALGVVDLEGDMKKEDLLGDLSSCIFDKITL